MVNKPNPNDLFKFLVGPEILIKYMDASGIYPLLEDGKLPEDLEKRLGKTKSLSYICHRPAWSKSVYLQHHPSRKLVWDVAIANSKNLGNCNWIITRNNKVVENVVDLETSYLGMFTGELIPFFSGHCNRYASNISWEEAQGELFEASLHFLVGYFAGNGEAMGYIHQQFDRSVWNSFYSY